MKILHINTAQEGGAAWCARRINNALVQQGVESRMLFAEGESMPEGIDGAIAEKDPYPWDKNWALLKIRHLINRFPWVCDADKWKYDLTLAQEKAGTQLYLHHPCSHYTNIAHHPLVEWADVIHLHWVPDFVDYPSFFKKVKKPIVWTLHDQFPAAGLKHFCGEASAFPDSIRALDAKCIRVKRRGILQAENLHIVAISEMMREICSESEVLMGVPNTLIHNGVDSNIFIPMIEAPGVQIQENANVFLFSSYGIWDERKGLLRVIEALERVQCGDKVLVVIGNSDGRIPKASFPIICTGLIRNQSELAKLYSRADFFVQASYEESFGQTILESMSCGTPVISTRCGIASELVKPFNGVICPGFDSGALCRGIEEALTKEFDREKIRQYILENYDYSIIARQYIQLYQSVL